MDFSIANHLVLPHASEGVPPSDTTPLSSFVKGASPPSPLLGETGKIPDKLKFILNKEYT